MNRLDRLIVVIFNLLFSTLLQASEWDIPTTQEFNLKPQLIPKTKSLSTDVKTKVFDTEPSIWGVALTYRIAEIPYPTSEKTVSDVIPLLFYRKDRFFWYGLEGGYTFANYNSWNASLLARYRYFDIPAEYQNTMRGNAYDLGLRYRYKKSDYLDFDIEIMNDLHERNYVNFASKFHWDAGDWDIKPYINLRWKSRKFNNYYFGLDSESPGSDFDLSIATRIRYHVHSNLYLLGQATFTMYGSDTYNSTTVNRPNQSEIFLGFGFFKDKNREQYRYLKSKPYVRIANGSATSSNVGQIINGDAESDIFNNKFTSIFYGIPVSDTFFGINLPIYLTAGYVQHHNSLVQGSFPEYVVGIKGYYTVNWPIRWRMGLAEGLSYASKITYIEQTEMDSKGYRASNLLNYIDFTIDVDLGDLFNSKALDNMWLGYGIHHRSGIFETSSTFGRIKGGSNYTMLYLQYHW